MQTFTEGARLCAVDPGAGRRYSRWMRAAGASEGSIRVESLLLEGDGQFFNGAHAARVYRGVLDERHPDPGAAFEALFAAHGWPPAWRAGLYTTHHYHSSAHEVLGIMSGWVKARLGGPSGVLVTLRAGDVVLLPAGVAHCNEGESSDFLAVGAYPRGMRPDMRYGREAERAADQRRAAALPPPTPDPVFGERSPVDADPGLAP